MKILLTGGTGQLGRAFRDAAAGRHEVIAYGHSDPAPAGILRLQDERAVQRAVDKHKPDWIVNAAAMTDVDACERDHDAARSVNSLGPGYLAKATETNGSKMLHVSTDYVFDGEKGMYTEADEPAPIQSYGRSKLEGERLVLEHLPEALIARTSVVFHHATRGFVTWLIGNLRSGSPVRIVEDQWVSPTYAPSLAQQVLALIEAGETGIWHTAGADRMSRLEMANAVADAFGFDPALITPVKMAEFEWWAKRPRDSSLDVTKVSRTAKSMGFTEALAAIDAAEKAEVAS